MRFAELVLALCPNDRREEDLERWVDKGQKEAKRI